MLAGWPLEVVHVPGAGRGVVTTRAVAAGELLLSARPYAVALDNAWLDCVCLGCGRTARSPYSLRCEVRRARRARAARRAPGAAPWDGAGIRNHPRVPRFCNGLIQFDSNLSRPTLSQI